MVRDQGTYLEGSKVGPGFPTSNECEGGTLNLHVTFYHSWGSHYAARLSYAFNVGRTAPSPTRHCRSREPTADGEECKSRVTYNAMGRFRMYIAMSRSPAARLARKTTMPWVDCGKVRRMMMSTQVCNHHHLIVGISNSSWLFGGSAITYVSGV